MLQNVNLFGAFLKGGDARAGDTLDLVLKALAEQAGAVVPLKALLDLAGGSLSTLLDAVSALSSRGLVEEVKGSGVRITETGKDIADSLRPATK